MHLGRIAERTPDKPAVTMASDGSTTSYAEPDRRTNPGAPGGEVVAHAEAGPRPGLTDWTLRPLPEEVPCST
jgi:hypothetical protein